MSLAFRTGNHIRFHGTKLALFIGDNIVTILRDDISTIPWPNHWDLVGGGREGSESAIECTRREAKEEIGLDLAKDIISWGRRYRRGDLYFWFFAAHLPQSALHDIRFGNEGQRWELVSPESYLANDRAIPRFQSRLSDYLSGRPSHL